MSNKTEQTDAESREINSSDYVHKQGAEAGGDRYMLLALAIRNRDRIIGTLLIILVICVFWMGKIGSQSKYEPVYVQVDKLANIVKVEFAENSQPINPKKIIYAEIGRAIEEARMVVGDKLLQKKMQKRLYAKIPKVGAAKQYLDDMFRGRDPFEIAKTMTIDVQIVNQLPTGEKSWEVEWFEQKIDIRGQKIGDPEHWKAILTTDISPSEKREVIELNPMGLYISSISLARKL